MIKEWVKGEEGLWCEGRRGRGERIEWGEREGKGLGGRKERVREETGEGSGREVREKEKKNSGRKEMVGWKLRRG